MSDAGVASNRFIEKLRIFGDLGAAAEDALTAATSKRRTFPSGHDLVREGDATGSVVVMLDGWACRYKIMPGGGRQILAFVMPGDCCDLRGGLIADIDHSIQTITPSIVAVVDEIEMDNIAERHRSILKAMHASQLGDEAAMRAWLVSMGRRTSLERVAHLMLELSCRARRIGIPTEPYMTLPISQVMLADALGITPVHINRVLKSLRLSNALSVRGGTLTITDPAKLAQFAGFDASYLNRRLRASAPSNAEGAVSSLP